MKSNSNNPRTSIYNLSGSNTIKTLDNVDSSKIKSELKNNPIIEDEDYIPFELLKNAKDPIFISKAYYLPKLKTLNENKLLKAPESDLPSTLRTMGMLSEKRSISPLVNAELLEK